MPIYTYHLKVWHGETRLMAGRWSGWSIEQTRDAIRTHVLPSMWPMTPAEEIVIELELDPDAEVVGAMDQPA